MASSRWNHLPTDILSTISKILNTDVDNLRLRSVCSSWRSSLPPRLHPSPFPLKLPHPSSTEENYFLNYTTIYRLSPPEHGPFSGDPSDGWLFRVSELSPNHFTLLSLMDPIRASHSPPSFPKLLNLLHYHITEVSKCYYLTSVDCDLTAAKVFVISDDKDFVVFALFKGGYACCLKYGQKDWIPIDHVFADMIVSDGKCYAISIERVLFCFDSDLNLIETCLAPLPGRYVHMTMDMMEYKSDLYVIARTYQFPGMRRLHGSPLPFNLEIFKKRKYSWESVRCWPDEAIVCCQDAAIVVQLEDFRSFKCNCAYVILRSPRTCSESGESITYFGVYDFDEAETAVLEPARRSQLMLQAPPSWLF